MLTTQDEGGTSLDMFELLVRPGKRYPRICLAAVFGNCTAVTGKTHSPNIMHPRMRNTQSYDQAECVLVNHFITKDIKFQPIKNQYSLDLK